MPDYVKSASVLTSEEAQGLRSDCFADSVTRKFALDSKANCWCSALYFYGNQCNTSPTSKQAELKLVNAARVWGISDDVETLKRAFESSTIPVSYAMSFEYRGSTVNRCPDHTKEAATASAEWLFANRFKFPVEVQKQAATRLLAKADTLKLDMQVSGYLDRLANSDTYSNVNCKIAMAITDRLGGIPSVKWTELEDELLKVANDLNSKPFEICSNPSLIAGALEAIDVRHGLNSKWGSSLAHPVDACLRANIAKVAADAGSLVHLTTGTPVDLARISDHQLEKGLKIAGDDFLSYCQTDGLNVDRSKAAEILPTLPKPEARRFESAIKSAGYMPESAYDLVDRLFKEGQQGMPHDAFGAMPPVTEVPEMSPKTDVVPQPEPWEDDVAFQSRMESMKEDARLATLDAQAGIAAAKARQARQEKIINPNAQQAVEAQG